MKTILAALTLFTLAQPAMADVVMIEKMMHPTRLSVISEKPMPRDDMPLASIEACQALANDLTKLQNSDPANFVRFAYICKNGG